MEFSERCGDELSRLQVRSFGLCVDWDIDNILHEPIDEQLGRFYSLSLRGRRTLIPRVAREVGVEARLVSRVPVHFSENLAREDLTRGKALNHDRRNLALLPDASGPLLTQAVESSRCEAVHVTQAQVPGKRLVTSLSSACGKIVEKRDAP